MWTEPNWLSKDNIISDINEGVSTRRKLTYCKHGAFCNIPAGYYGFK